MKLYIDTNVYVDFFLERSKSIHAEKIFFQTLFCRHRIILSDHVLSELTKHIPLDKIKMLFEALKMKLILVRLEDEDKAAAALLPTHYADAIHVVLAKNANAIVTNNIRDFAGLFQSHRPEDI